MATKAKKTWNYVCMDCGRKMQRDSSEGPNCPRCVKAGMPGDRIAKKCCNTCRHAGEWDGDSRLLCNVDNQSHELGYVCDSWKNMEGS